MTAPQIPGQLPMIPPELAAMMEAVNEATAAASEPVKLEMGPELHAAFNTLRDQIGTLGRANSDLFALYESQNEKLEKVLAIVTKLDELRVEVEPHVKKLRKLMLPRAFGGKVTKE